MPVFSYSIKPKDTENLIMLEKLRLHAEEQGVSMSHIIINCLKPYYNEITKNDQGRKKAKADCSSK